MLPFIGIGVTSTSVTAINVFDEIVALSGYSDLGEKYPCGKLFDDL